jgi:hypothetical protein
LAARRISTTVKVAVALLIIAALFAFGLRRLLVHKMFDQDEDRPPIIVHNGSLLFDTAKNWKRGHPSIHRFKPDHPRGHSVGSYSVVLTGSSTAACTGTTLTGLEVFVDYRADPQAAVKQFHLYRRLTFTTPGTVKKEPSLDSPEPLTIVPGTGSAPSQLVYPVGNDGWISNVTVGSVSCAFTRPATPADRSAVRVEITPEV